MSTGPRQFLRLEQASVQLQSGDQQQLLPVQQLDEVRIRIIAHDLRPENSSSQLEASGTGLRSAAVEEQSKDACMAVRKTE